MNPIPLSRICNHEELYRRLMGVVSMKDLGSNDLDDRWIKHKFLQAIMPFEENTSPIISKEQSFHAFP
jgi:hypothetical protein